MRWDSTLPIPHASISLLFAWRIVIRPYFVTNVKSRFDFFFILRGFRLRLLDVVFYFTVWHSFAWWLSRLSPTGGDPQMNKLNPVSDFIVQQQFFLVVNHHYFMLLFVSVCPIKLLLIKLAIFVFPSNVHLVLLFFQSSQSWS